MTLFTDNKYIVELHPDVILFSGDILNLSYIYDQQSWHDAREVIQQWNADLGVYFVSGSPAVDIPAVFTKVIKDLPLTWLENERITLYLKNGEKIEIYGLTCTHQPHLDKKVLSTIMDKKKNNYSILLYHSPDLAPDAAEMGIDLELSGHTHGGQICLPFYGAIITGPLYGKTFEHGEKQLGNLTLLVTSGIGMEGGGAPRVRFLCPPEIHLIELSGEVERP